MSYALAAHFGRCPNLWRNPRVLFLHEGEGKTTPQLAKLPTARNFPQNTLLGSRDGDRLARANLD